MTNVEHSWSLVQYASAIALHACCGSTPASVDASVAPDPPVPAAPLSGVAPEPPAPPVPVPLPPPVAFPPVPTPPVPPPEPVPPLPAPLPPVFPPVVDEPPAAPAPPAPPFALPALPPEPVPARLPPIPVVPDPGPREEQPTAAPAKRTSQRLISCLCLDARGGKSGSRKGCWIACALTYRIAHPRHIPSSCVVSAPFSITCRGGKASRRRCRRAS
jgi:hypothetical protein